MKNQESTTKTKAPTFKGVVTSAKMDKTVVVAVDTLKRHAKYKKQFQSTKKYKVHTEENKYKVGDIVLFRECRPMSRGKHHQVIEG